MASMRKVPDVEGVIVISSVLDQPPEHMIQKILQSEVLPNSFAVKDCIKGYEWKIDTKYYTATANLYSIQNKADLNSEFCDKIKAIVFYFDGNVPSSFEDVLSWFPILDDTKSEVQLLVCEKCDWDETHRSRILIWCVENQFEFIEINSTEENDDDDDSGIFSKSKGYGRVIEALQSHMWSNLVMKEDTAEKNIPKTEENKPNSESSASCVSSQKTTDNTKKMTVENEEDTAEKNIPRTEENKTNDESSASCASSQESIDDTKKMTVENEELLLEEQWLQKVFEGDDANGESFEALFSKFASMKERASNLSGDERKKYAEKVAIAFWKAMGGENEEIEGLDDE